MFCAGFLSAAAPPFARFAAIRSLVALGRDEGSCQVLPRARKTKLNHQWKQNQNQGTRFPAPGRAFLITSKTS
jgi:hypothetical protein